MEKSISLIIPAYNEEKRVRTVLEKYVNYLKKNFLDFELIVICNNCNDRTPGIVKDFSKKEKNVILMNFPYRTGKGGAVIEGFKKAKNELIGFTDCDRSTSPEQFHKLVQALGKGTDVAIASRALAKSIMPVAQPFYRRFLGLGFSFIVNLLFNLNIMDTQCGAKIFKKEAIKKILPELILKGFEFDVEILWRAKKAGYKIKEVPIVWINEKESKVSPFSVIAMFVGLLKLYFSR